MPKISAVRVDSNYLVRALVNILGNAHGALSEHKERRGTVEVRTWEDDEQVYIRLRDSGPGVPADLRDRIFDPFFSTKQGGVGLGLSVARDLLERSGGMLEVEDVTKGASFLLTLASTGQPLRHSTATARIPEKPKPLKGLSVLVVDDEDTIRTALERFFSLSGATVRTAADGEEALAALQAENFDVVMLDIRMPGLDGIQVYKQLGEDNPALQERTIILTGDISAVHAGLNIPENRVLVKPVELAELKRVVQVVVGRWDVSGRRAPRRRRGAPVPAGDTDA